MSNRLLITPLVYMMVQAVMFCAGLLIVLMTPLRHHAFVALPSMVAITALISLPVSYVIAPRLTARYWRGRSGDVISG